MNIIKCSIPDCKSIFGTNEPIAPDARYVCRHHTREEQEEFIGRKYNPETDELDKQATFQRFQFDKKLKNKGRGES